MLARTSLVLTAVLSLVAAPAYARECEDVTMPDRVTVEGQPLVLNGMGVREATALQVNVYVAGLYLRARSRNGAQIAAADEIKRLEMRFVRDVDRDDIVSAYRDSFRRNGGAALGDRVNQFIALMPAATEGARWVLTYIPGTGTRVEINGRVRGTIPGVDFQRVVFSIWLGANPPNSGLKTGLLGGECG